MPQQTNLGHLEIVPAEEAIAMDEEPVSGIKRKPKASINVAMELVKPEKQKLWFQRALWRRHGSSSSA
jgi:glycerol-3-phosphate acyltransferase PlsX